MHFINHYFILILLFNHARMISMDINSDGQNPISFNLEKNNKKFTFLTNSEGELFLSKNNEENVLHFQHLGNQDIITSDYNLIIKNNLNIENGNIFLSDKSQWKLVFLDDFQDTNKGWNNFIVSACQNNMNTFLGGHCNYGGEEVHITIDIPQHKQIMIKFNINLIDEWEGETFYAKLDGFIFHTESYNWCDKLIPWYCKKYNIDVCGKQEFPDRMSIPVQYVGKHNSELIQLLFGSNLQKKACDASWGIDDLQIFIR